mmetsp:Transcript_46987/g.135370  ORF Transcript_46987/g.135370 Transcript_46987/m.135370 type:complete len:315 (+) Transcript_46987:8-952(+)
MASTTGQHWTLRRRAVAGAGRGLGAARCAAGHEPDAPLGERSPRIERVQRLRRRVLVLPGVPRPCRGGATRAQDHRCSHNGERHGERGTSPRRRHDDPAIPRRGGELTGGGAAIACQRKRRPMMGDVSENACETNEARQVEWEHLDLRAVVSWVRCRRRALIVRHLQGGNGPAMCRRLSPSDILAEYSRTRLFPMCMSNIRAIVFGANSCKLLGSHQRPAALAGSARNVAHEEVRHFAVHSRLVRPGQAASRVQEQRSDGRRDGSAYVGHRPTETEHEPRELEQRTEEDLALNCEGHCARHATSRRWAKRARPA